MKILVTGAAGFIGFSLCQRLLNDNHAVYGIDNLNDYYSIQLKRDRLDQLISRNGFTFQRLDVFDRPAMQDLFTEESFTHVIHLAAQAGVRYSLQNPYAYADSNLSGFLNVLEGCRHSSTQHLVFASSSSVYGANRKVPFSTQDNVDHPVSLYAATKKANELMAHAYSHLYTIPMTGLRFFTVYGPWGRPDMAYFKFVDAIAKGRSIDVYNHGKMKRDFTYIDDVVEGIVRVMQHPPQVASEATTTHQSPNAPYKVYNIGNHSPVELMQFIEVIEAAMGQPAKKVMKPMQAGDVTATYADVEDLMQDVGFQPATPIEVGIQKFVAWYHSYYS
ncbi:MAG: NAD-dependent epimerase [Cyanobacteria bacterium J06639_14]